MILTGLLAALVISFFIFLVWDAICIAFEAQDDYWPHSDIDMDWDLEPPHWVNEG